jgi:predicted Fe-Mo cluster-binding NifX family protein
MRLCIPTTSDAGVAARLSPHFGRAPYFTLIDAATGEIAVVGNDGCHGPGGCDPLSSLAAGSLDAVVCHGMGRRALSGLNARGVDVFVTDGATVTDAVAGFRAGRLRRLELSAACGGSGSHG